MSMVSVRAVPIGAIRRVARMAVVLALVGFVLGGVVFAVGVSRGGGAAAVPSGADGLVALTGGGGVRIRAALDLLAAGHGDRLLISGVHPDTSMADLRRLAPGHDGLFACCVDLGQTATTTRGNAVEIAEWAGGKGYHRITIVTSDFHMPRSLIEIRALSPGVVFFGYTTPATDGDGPWWLDADGIRKISVEYVKYLFVRFKPPPTR